VNIRRYSTQAENAKATEIPQKTVKNFRPTAIQISAIL
jgi:hypothetical protein